MTETHVPARIFARAAQDAEAAKKAVCTPQTEAASYRLAYQDEEFLLREDLRPVRFQLELLKTEVLLDEAKMNLGTPHRRASSSRFCVPSTLPAAYPSGSAIEGRTPARAARPSTAIIARITRRRTMAISGARPLSVSIPGEFGASKERSFT